MNPMYRGYEIDEDEPLFQVYKILKPVTIYCLYKLWNKALYIDCFERFKEITAALSVS
jgi:hypothetical protein